MNTNTLQIPDASDINIVNVSFKENYSEEVPKEEFPALHPRIFFLRRIYSLLFLINFFIIIFSSFLVYSLKVSFLKNWIVLLVSFILFFLSLVVIFLRKDTISHHSKAFFWFMLFYLEILVFCSSLMSFDDSTIFLMIFSELDAVFLFLAIYSFITQNLLTYQVASLFILAPIFVIFNIFLIFSQISLQLLIFLSVIGIIWGFYMIYETQTIMKAGKADVEKNDVFIEAITIYFDLFLLFLRNTELISNIILTKKPSPIVKKKEYF